jgi:hypothetical protein
VPPVVPTGAQLQLFYVSGGEVGGVHVGEGCTGGDVGCPPWCLQAHSCNFFTCQVARWEGCLVARGVPTPPPPPRAAYDHSGVHLFVRIVQNGTNRKKILKLRAEIFNVSGGEVGGVYG